MKRHYEQLSIQRLCLGLEGMLASSVRMKDEVTVENYKDAFKKGGTLESPGIVDIPFE